MSAVGTGAQDFTCCSLITVPSAKHVYFMLCTVYWNSITGDNAVGRRARDDAVGRRVGEDAVGRRARDDAVGRRVAGVQAPPGP